MTDYFKIQIAATRLKDAIKHILKATLVEEGVLASVDGKDLPSSTVSAGGEMRTHVEFTRELVTHFGRWCSSSSFVYFEELYNLVVIEQF